MRVAVNAFAVEEHVGAAAFHDIGGTLRLGQRFRGLQPLGHRVADADENGARFAVQRAGFHDGESGAGDLLKVTAQLAGGVLIDGAGGVRKDDAVVGLAIFDQWNRWLGGRVARQGGGQQQADHEAHDGAGCESPPVELLGHDCIL